MFYFKNLRGSSEITIGDFVKKSGIEHNTADLSKKNIYRYLKLTNIVSLY